MYESFDNLRVKVVQTPSILGPYTPVHEKSATYSRVLTESKAILEKMSEADSILWDYYEKIGINPQDSFVEAIDNQIFKYLLRMALRIYGVELYDVAFEENGTADLDEVVIFIK